MNIYPAKTEYGSFYETYISKVSPENYMGQLSAMTRDLTMLLEGIPDEQWDFRYQPEKWTIKELILHIIDTERVMAYRALWIARDNQTPLPGFDQDEFIITSNANHRSKTSLIKKLKAVRAATITLFETLVPGKEWA